MSNFNEFAVPGDWLIGEEILRPDTVGRPLVTDGLAAQVGGLHKPAELTDEAAFAQASLNLQS